MAEVLLVVEACCKIRHLWMMQHPLCSGAALAVPSFIQHHHLLPREKWVPEPPQQAPAIGRTRCIVLILLTTLSWHPSDYTVQAFYKDFTLPLIPYFYSKHWQRRKKVSIIPTSGPQKTMIGLRSPAWATEEPSLPGPWPFQHTEIHLRLAWMQA